MSLLFISSSRVLGANMKLAHSKFSSAPLRFTGTGANGKVKLAIAMPYAKPYDGATPLDALKQRPEIEFVGEASTPDGWKALLEQQKPDVVVVWPERELFFHFQTVDRRNRNDQSQPKGETTFSWLPITPLKLLGEYIRALLPGQKVPGIILPGLFETPFEELQRELGEVPDEKKLAFRSVDFLQASSSADAYLDAVKAVDPAP